MPKISKQLLILYVSVFLIKGWEVSLIFLLPFIQQISGLTLSQVGILASCMSVMQIGCAFFAGNISQKIGSKGVLAFSALCYLFAWFSLLFDTSFANLVVMFTLAGIASGLFMPIGNSAVAKISKSSTMSIANFSASADLGRVGIAGITALVVGILGISAISLIFVILSFVVLIFFTFTKFQIDGAKEGKVVTDYSLKQLMGDTRYKLAVLTGVADAFASSSLFIFIPFLLLEKGISIEAASLTSTLFFLGYFSGRLLLGRLAEKYDETKVLIVAEILMASLLIALILVENYYSVMVILFLLGVFTRGTSPIIRAMVAHSVVDHYKFDRAYSFYSFSVHTSSVLNRSALGFLASVAGVSSIFWVSGVIALVTIIPIRAYAQFKNSKKT